MNKTEPTFWAEICIAGDFDMAVELCQGFVDEFGLCVTVTPTMYVYTGGYEDGVLVRLINYPRFPAHWFEILGQASKLAKHLKIGLGQGSYSIVTPDKTYWVSTRECDNGEATEQGGSTGTSGSGRGSEVVSARSRYLARRAHVLQTAKE